MMISLRKSFTAAATSITLFGLVAGSAVPAQAGDGAAIAAGAIGGLAAGAILGGALAGGGGYYPSYGYGYSYAAPVYSAPAYSYGYAAPAPVYYRACYRHRRPIYDDFGDFAGYRVVRTCS
ncbi:MAG: hypothetical protein NVS2B5_10290 [Beijerinckiaceae bacterium]